MPHPHANNTQCKQQNMNMVSGAMASRGPVNILKETYQSCVCLALNHKSKTEEPPRDQEHTHGILCTLTLKAKVPNACHMRMQSRGRPTVTRSGAKKKSMACHGCSTTQDHCHHPSNPPRRGDRTRRATERNCRGRMATFEPEGAMVTTHLASPRSPAVSHLATATNQHRK